MVETNGVIFGQSFSNLELAINEASLRQKSIAANIANIESENFNPATFQGALDKAKGKLADKQVLLDEELMKLSKNNIEMTSYFNLLSSRLKAMRKVVTLGKG